MKVKNMVLFCMILSIFLIASGCVRTGFFERRVPVLIAQAEADLTQAEAESDKQHYNFPELKIAEDNLREAKKLEGLRTEALLRRIFYEKEITANDVSLLAVASSMNSQVVLAKIRQAQQATENAQIYQQLDEVNLARSDIGKQLEAGRLVMSETNEQLTAECKIRAAQGARAENFMRIREGKRGLIVSLAGILFDVNKSGLEPGSARKLDTLAKLLKDHPDRRILVEGHTDGIGTDDYNQMLSEKRADAVRSYLISNGLSPNMVEAKGYGKKLPVATNDTAAGRQQNRRVDLVILNPTEEKTVTSSASSS